MSKKRQARIPRWYILPVRVALLTFIGTLLIFAISLMLGIVVTVVSAAHRHLNPDMTVAYRHIAVPAAVIAGSVVFVVTLVMEIRHYRQSKTLAEIARASEKQSLQIQH